MHIYIKKKPRPSFANFFEM